MKVKTVYRVEQENDHRVDADDRLQQALDDIIDRAEGCNQITRVTIDVKGSNMLKVMEFAALTMPIRVDDRDGGIRVATSWEVIPRVDKLVDVTPIVSRKRVLWLYRVESTEEGKPKKMEIPAGEVDYGGS